MALTQAQREMGEALILNYLADRRLAGNLTPTVELILDMTTAQRKAALLPYAQARQSSIESTQAALPAARTAQDAALATELTTAESLVTVLT